MKKRTIVSFLVGIVIIGITVCFYSNFSFYTNYFFGSSVYDIRDNYIYGVSSYTSVNLYKKYFDVDGYVFKIDLENEYISNGSRLILLDKNKKEVFWFINIVKGDIVSDGIVDDKDINFFREYLNNKYNLEEYQIKCMDIDDDGDITYKDLDLLENSLNFGIRDININEEEVILQVDEKYRLVAYVLPGYGINMNLNWESMNTDVVSVNESGELFAHEIGSTIVIVSDNDNKIKKEVKIVIDNTIKLSSNSGDLFVGEEFGIEIKALDYSDIKCVSSDFEVASCRIDGDILYVKAVGKGESVITVSSLKYGKVDYKLRSYSNYLDFIPDYYCFSSKGREIIDLGYIYDDVEVVNNKLIDKAYINGNLLYIESNGIVGREELIIKDSNDLKKKMIIDMYSLNIPSVGAFIGIGEIISADIVYRNTGRLECITSNSDVGECYVENNRLYVVGKGRGDVSLRITNTIDFNGRSYDCGETSFLAVVR